MQLRPRLPRRPNENIVPLINVVFLLLVFFMLTGTLRPAPSIDVELPVDRPDGTAVEVTAESPALSLSASGALVFDDAPVGLDGLRAAVRASGTQAISLRADARTPARVLLPVLEVLQNSGELQIDLVTDLAR